MPRKQLANNGGGFFDRRLIDSVMFALFSVFSGLPVEAAIMVKCKEGKISFLCVFCFSSPGFCSVKTR